MMAALGTQYTSAFDNAASWMGFSADPSALRIWYTANAVSWAPEWQSWHLLYNWTNNGTSARLANFNYAADNQAAVYINGAQFTSNPVSLPPGVNSVDAWVGNWGGAAGFVFAATDSSTGVVLFHSDTSWKVPTCPPGTYFPLGASACTCSPPGWYSGGGLAAASAGECFVFCKFDEMRSED